MTDEIERPVATVDDRHIPDELRELQVWVLWNGERKRPIAPWATGHLWWAHWRSTLDADERPETTYAEADRYANFRPTDLAGDYWIPPDANLHDRLEPTILLPHEGQGPERAELVMYIDLDDVRDPETDEISEEAAEIIERLDSYTEVSVSGTGVHIVVYARLPDGVATVDGDPLDDIGSIEMYDHGRLLAATWGHVEGTPTEINDRQATVDELIEEYSSHRLTDPSDDDGDGDDDGQPAETTDGGLRVLVSQTLPQGSSGRSPYFSVDLERFADAQALSGMDSIDKRGDDRQGAHPHHGKTTAGNKSYNYNLDTGENQWHCFAAGHNSGGGPMEMAAIMAGELNCADASAGSLDGMSDEAFLRTCLYARDNLSSFTKNMKPPYRALVTIAKVFDLPMANEDREILGETNYRYARAIYTKASVEDIDI